ncbi:MAG TPA: YncE family protein [Actinoplanes sp.]|nr:YncE family protein [Actinoplanes sp.]
MSERGLPPHVLTEIDSPIRDTRLTGVDELARLANGADLAMAAAARLALEGLTQDDSRSVAAAAAAALERTAVRLYPDRVDFGQVPPGTPGLVADVFVEGPPLAVATATVTVSGPGLRAMLTGRQLRIVWQPRSDWLDGLVTVHGPAGWADVSVTGRATAAEPTSHAVVAAQLRAVDSLSSGPARLTVLPPRAPARRRAGGTVLIACLTVLVLLGGVGVAVALTTGGRSDRTAAAVVSPPPTTASPSAPTAPAPPAISRVPLASRVVSTGKPAVVATIRVGAEPEGVIVSPNSRTVYVANQSSHVLSVVDAAGRRVTQVPLRNTPRFVSTSRDGRLVFVSMYEDDKSGSGVAVVDATSRKVLRYLSTGVQPYALAVGPDDRLWVPIHSQRRVEIYTAGGQRPDGRVIVPPNPHAVAFSAKLKRAFTADHESNAVSVIDTSTDRLLKSVPVSRAPHSIAVSPDGKTVLVAGYEANTADLIDAASLRRTGPIRVGGKPQSVAFAADGAHAYVVNEGDNSVSVLDGHTGAVTATIRVGRSPRTVAVSPDGRLAYVSNGADNTISVLRVGE